MRANGVGRIFVALTIVVGAQALGAEVVGKVSVVEGTAWAERGGADKVDLKVGSEIDVGDHLHTQGGGMRIDLEDQSVFLVDADSDLVIDEGKFPSKNRETFGVKLFLGKVWSHVTHAVTGKSKFEVSTQRAVAGVRGTIFRVDAIKTVAGTMPPRTIVRVTQGAVAVKKPQAGKQRVQVAGPHEVSKDAYEKQLEVMIKQGSQIEIGDEELWKPQPLVPAKDDFEQFIDKHGK